MSLLSSNRYDSDLNIDALQMEETVFEEEFTALLDSLHIQHLFMTDDYIKFATENQYHAVMQWVASPSQIV